MTVKFLDLKKINRAYDDELKQAFNRVLDSGWYILGSEVDNFEKAFAQYCGTKYCVGVASGLDALNLTLRAWIELGFIAKGDEVIVPANTYIASILCVIENDLKPVFVEPDESYCLSAQGVVAALTARTRVILPVHLYGQLADMDVLKKIANENNLLILEDCAQAHGATHNDISAGAFGDAGAFSFYPGKNLGALGDGGAIVSDDEKFVDCVRALRNYGSSKKYYNDYIGVNSRLDELQAALLLVKLKHLDQENQQRRELAQLYINNINNSLLQLPVYPEKSESHVWHLFVVKCLCERARFIKYLQDAGIGTMVHYPVPPHKQKALEKYQSLNLPVTEDIHERVVSLPLYPGFQEIEKVIEVCNKFS